jgi:hypothetical protein
VFAPEVTVTYSSHGEAAEFARQVAGQEAGLNRMTAGEIRANIEAYRASGRPSSASSAIQTARRQNPAAAAGNAALHEPDMVIGGNASIIENFGNLPVNSSIGSQNRTLQQVIYDAVKDLPADAVVNFRFRVQ